MLNEVWVGNINDNVEKLLKARFIGEPGESYAKAALHMHAQNEPLMKRYKAILNDLLDELYTIETNDKISDNCKYPLALIQSAQNQKKINTRGLGNLLILKIGAEVMLSINIDINDPLIKSQTGILGIFNLLKVVFVKDM